LLDWTSDHGIQEDAFIQRIEALSTMGYSVLLSNYRRYFKVANYLATFTRESIVIALGLPSLVVRTTCSVCVFLDCIFRWAGCGLLV
jgi:hypothetical protein